MAQLYFPQVQNILSYREYVADCLQKNVYLFTIADAKVACYT